MAQIRKHARLVLGVAAASVAGTAALLGPASAADAAGSSVNWDAVAQCESGGNWSINTGNGFYGGLQFTRGTWKAYGGTKYASTANRASRAQQITIAEKVLRGQGIGAWPVCGKKGGSSKHYSGTNTSGSQSESSKSVTHKSYKAKHRKATTTASARKATPTTTAKSTGKSYVVRSGDTLAAIAAKNHVKGGWHALYQLNDGTIGNPNLIFPGQRVAL